MAFSRDDLKAYEAKPAVQVDDKSFDPFNPPVAETTEPTPDTSTEEVSATEPTDTGDDGSDTTETKAEPVAAETADPDSEKTPETEEEVNDGKTRSRAQERIEDLVAERNALRKYGEYLLSQVDELRKAPQGAQQSTPTAPASQAETKEDPFPTLEDAEFDQSKLADLQRSWFKKQVDKEVKSAVRQIETRQSEVAIRQAFEQRTAEFRKTAPDFDLVIANPALPRLSQEAAVVVVRSDNGPAIAYHLAKNPDLAARISRLDNVSQAAAIGRIEEQLARSKTDDSTQKEPSKPKQVKEPVKVTKAPPPPKPVSGSSAVEKSASTMSMEEFVANERGKKIREREERLKLRKVMR